LPPFRRLVIESRRLSQYGPNRLPEGKQRGPLMRFLAQLHYPGVNSFSRQTEEGNLLALHPTQPHHVCAVHGRPRQLCSQLREKPGRHQMHCLHGRADDNLGTMTLQGEPALAP
jgi:Cation transporter/ATPase, N-terminus